MVAEPTFKVLTGAAVESLVVVNHTLTLIKDVVVWVGVTVKVVIDVSVVGVTVVLVIEVVVVVVEVDV